MNPSARPALSSYAGGGIPFSRRLAALGRRMRSLLITALLLSPSILAVAYYGFIAADRYESEARFVIRTASKSPSAIGGLGALMQLIGMSRSQDDAYAVRDYLLSRNALEELRRRIDLARIYDHPDADLLTRYPSRIFVRTDEDFYRYFQYRLSVIVNSSSGLTILRSEAFRGEDAALVARTLLQLGEAWINRLNERVLEDAVRVAQAEVTRAEQRRLASQLAITNFRNKELVLDPTKSAAIIVELIGKLSAELATVRADIAETQGNARNSPQLLSMQQRAEALERQIAFERARISSGADGIADKIATYEKLMLEQQFASRALDQAMSALQLSWTEARRQQLFLEHVVEPLASDEATQPHRWRMIATVIGFNIVGFGVFWLIATGLREHGQGHR